MLLKDKLIYTSYGRTAIYLALMSINVKGKEVVLPAFTCETTLPTAIMQAGGIPVFVDVRREDLSLNIKDLKSKISKETKVVISHCYYGYFNQRSIEEIDAIAREYRLLHIEDRAHCLGIDKEIYGDIAVYSFSKALNSPGGGYLEFKNEELFLKALNFQLRNKRLFHSLVMNIETFSYMKNLEIDRSCKRYSKEQKINLLFRTLLKILSESGLYQKDYFYKVSGGQKAPFLFLDTRMTDKQRRVIEKQLANLPSIIQRRKYVAERLNSFLPSYFPLENNVFTNYVYFNSNPEYIETLQEKLWKVDIKTRRPWPFFQNYWNEQITNNVVYLKDRLLLIDLDCINEEKFRKLEQII